MVATADQDWAAGEWLGGPGAAKGPKNLGYHPGLRATMVPGFSLSGDRAAPAPVPFFMLEGCRLAANVPCGAAITKDMVVRPADSVLWDLRQQQDRQFEGQFASEPR
jgi:predicted homoserine dehydrogenase-like protein